MYNVGCCYFIFAGCCAAAAAFVNEQLVLHWSNIIMRCNGMAALKRQRLYSFSFFVHEVAFSSGIVLEFSMSTHTQC